MAKVIDIYGGKDPGEMPIYLVSEASRYLHTSPSTLRSWLVGTDNFRPLLIPAKTNPCMLSFYNFVEAFVLGSLRRHHGLTLPSVRKALAEYTRQTGHQDHPLARGDFRTDGVSLFVEVLGHLVNLNKDSQREMREVMGQYLKYVEFDAQFAVRLHPYRPGATDADARRITIDPRLAFGRPVIVGTRVPIDELASRRKAGDSLATLAEDFRIDKEMVRAALRWEFGSKAA